MNAIQDFIDDINQTHNISMELEEFLRSSLKEKRYNKNHTLINVGHLPKELYYLASGSAKVCYFNPQTQTENVLWFWLPQQLVLPLEGFAKSLRSESSIVLNQNATVISISLVHIKYLPKLFPEFVNLAHIILEELVKNLSDHLELVKYATAQQRYQFLLKHQPALLDMVSLRDIASFLGMSINTLNHIRGAK